jgi:phage tail-like protein
VGLIHCCMERGVFLRRDSAHWVMHSSATSSFARGLVHNSRRVPYRHRLGKLSLVAAFAAASLSWHVSQRPGAPTTFGLEFTTAYADVLANLGEPDPVPMAAVGSGATTVPSPPALQGPPLAANLSSSHYSYRLEMGFSGPLFFSEVGGLGHQLFVQSSEGGVRKSPGRATTTDLILRRGFAPNDRQLFDWMTNIRNGIQDIRSGTLVFVDSSGTDRADFVLTRAFPIKWVATNVNPKSGTLAIEELTLSVEEVEWQDAGTPSGGQ